MSSATNAPPLNRRASIHSAPRPAQQSRQYSTLEIEVEYISTGPLPAPRQPLRVNEPTSLSEANINNKAQKNGKDAALNSVMEEDEEGEETGAGTRVGVTRYTQSAQPPSIPTSTRPYPATLPRQRPSRPLSEQYYPSQQQSAHHHHLPDDQFARAYQPSLQPRSQGVTPPIHSNRPGPGFRGYSAGSSVSSNVSGSQGQAAIPQSEYLQSSHAQHDETPVLSSAGSQSDDNDEDEVHSPVDCLHPVGDDDDDYGELGEHSAAELGAESFGGADGHRVPSNIDQSEHRKDASYHDVQEAVPELETQETLKRERTRILERTVVNNCRQIDFKDITNIQPLKRGGYGEIHTAEWSRLRVVLKRALPENNEGVEQFDQEVCLEIGIRLVCLVY
ncbi:hypothetical protein BCR41DRAFT_88253 [Lobosporangium transversale]|uniref:Protein kinase domain-containing protein n=1 Tax=Lobosporangium transversale TaxID=64571 RepID=A0A1Y2GQQ6_9FUNG|nr:hypothetical protein BCR41DRAFT_88253 [Lobosporangium transversale]ORZ14455.1 hypothetical protein BCR41DRAFT_88253 [Lobosporangium transversale]|eukprot:XP_021880933.1 hypothetical protein BCR41DRAFT_88253 [Lobosporangium transversale]